MTTYTVEYFPVNALAWVERAILSLAGVEYKNEFPDWLAERGRTPFGRLPVLKETRPDGTELVLAESCAIDIYLSEKYGYLPKDVTEKAIALQYYFQYFDVLDKFIAYKLYYKTNEARDRYIDRIKTFIHRHESILSKSKSGYYCGDSMTLPDICIYHLYKEISGYEDQTLNYFAKEKIPSITNLLGDKDAQLSGTKGGRTFDDTNSNKLNLPPDNIPRLELSNLKSPSASRADGYFKRITQPCSTACGLENNNRKNKRISGVFPEIKALGGKRIKKISTIRDLKINFLLNQGYKLYSKLAASAKKPRQEKNLIIKISSFLSEFNKIKKSSNIGPILESSNLMLEKLKLKTKNEANEDKVDNGTKRKLINKIVKNPTLFVEN
ncbi:hypothetical protein BB560_006446 [Smittium megazygosporum]|uniref:GST N-terminal domain-containing protein n=1 Tax=Smittium megazygosporum TaxID=133381 RepID=A0A2T9Y5V8_9FUNG|nr:hypothetical protein BB560_006446 [Smittium megazygosporum]